MQEGEQAIEQNLHLFCSIGLRRYEQNDGFVHWACGGYAPRHGSAPPPPRPSGRGGGLRRLTPPLAVPFALSLFAPPLRLLSLFLLRFSVPLPFQGRVLLSVLLEISCLLLSGSAPFRAVLDREGARRRGFTDGREEAATSPAIKYKAVTAALS